MSLQNMNPAAEALAYNDIKKRGGKMLGTYSLKTVLHVIDPSVCDMKTGSKTLSHLVSVIGEDILFDYDTIKKIDCMVILLEGKGYVFGKMKGISWISVENSDYRGKYACAFQDEESLSIFTKDTFKELRQLLKKY